MSASNLTPERIEVLRNALAELTRVQALSAMTQDALRDAEARGLEIDVGKAHAIAGAISDLIADLRRVANV